MERELLHGWQMESRRNNIFSVEPSSATGMEPARAVSPAGIDPAVPAASLPSATELAGALHEVSNALTVVIGWLDEALASEPAAPLRDALEVARAHAGVGHRLARAAIGAEVPVAADRPAIAVAREAVLGVQPHARAEGVSVLLDPGETAATVGDSAVTLQILVNLLLNAVAFTPRGARVTLTLRERGSSVVFAVADQGPGVAPDRAARLLSGPSSTRRGGAGVGLTHSASLAYDHGGRLELVRPGPGAVFELTWPRRESASEVQIRATRPAHLEGRRVLVVEDDANVLALVELALEARGAQVLSAICPLDMVELVGNGQTFDVALIDLSPFADDSTGALVKLREAVTGAGVILMSGHVGELPAALEGKVARWVRKPFDMPELTEAIEAVITGAA